MNNKLDLLLSFIPVSVTKFSALAKNLMQFTVDQKSIEIVKKFGFPNGLPTVDILDLVPDFNLEVGNYTFLDGTSMVSDLALLKGLSKKIKNCDYFEIGSWRGESLLNVAEYAASCTSLSLSKEEMKQMKLVNGFMEMDGYFIKELPNLTMFRHNSQTFDFKKLNKKFDLIFVDGDHTFDAVVNDTKNVFPLLKNDDSLIVWHDCGLTYEDTRWEVVAAILEGAPPDKRKHIYRVSNTLCAVYHKGEIKSSYKTFPSVPTKLFDVSLKTKKI